jgi:hypothetical protein
MWYNNDDKSKMKNLITVLFLMFSLVSFSQTNYPIKTIFKGDSVIILTIQQSEDINAVIEKNSKLLKESNKKIKERDEQILKLESVLLEQNVYIDSLSKILLKHLNREDTVNSLIDSLWKWSLGPSLIYTQYPDDSTVYIMDLSHHYMTTDDFGIIMVQMSDREYKKYQEFIQNYGMSEQAFWDFRNNIRIKRLPSDEIDERRVWKFRKQWSKPKEDKK